MESTVLQPEGDSSILELQRKLRILENDTKAYGEEAQAQIRRQRYVIEMLTSENQSVKLELQHVREAVSAQQSTLLGEKMQKLNDQCVVLAREIEEEREQEKEILSKFAVIEGRVMKCREQMGSLGGVYAATVCNESIGKQMRILENRLNKSLQKYSEAAAYNKKLKEDINNLRKERVTFDSLYKKAERDLMVKKKNVLDLIDVANKAYAARDEAQQQVTLVKAAAAKERKCFDQEWLYLQQLLESLQKRHLSRNNGTNERSSECNNAASKDPDSWATEDDMPAPEAGKLEAFQAAFAKIRYATGIEEVEKLIDAFHAAEEHNFSLFNYVNSLSHEAETHEAAIAKLQLELQSCASTASAANSMKQKTVQELENRSACIEEQTKRIEETSRVASNKLQSLMRGIETLFIMIDGPEKHKEELWAKESINELTITFKLQAIEQSLHQMMELMEAKGDSSDDDTPTSKSPHRNRSPMQHGNGPYSPEIKLPSAINRTSSLDTSEDEENDTRPLTRDELRDRFLKVQCKKDDRRRLRQKKNQK